MGDLLNSNINNSSVYGPASIEDQYPPMQIIPNTSPQPIVNAAGGDTTNNQFGVSSIDNSQQNSSIVNTNTTNVNNFGNYGKKTDWFVDLDVSAPIGSIGGSQPAPRSSDRGTPINTPPGNAFWYEDCFTSGDSTTQAVLVWLRFDGGPWHPAKPGWERTGFPYLLVEVLVPAGGTAGTYAFFRGWLDGPVDRADSIN